MASRKAQRRDDPRSDEELPCAVCGTEIGRTGAVLVGTLRHGEPPPAEPGFVYVAVAGAWIPALTLWRRSPIRRKGGHLVVFVCSAECATKLLAAAEIDALMGGDERPNDAPKYRLMHLRLASEARPRTRESLADVTLDELFGEARERAALTGECSWCNAPIPPQMSDVVIVRAASLSSAASLDDAPLGPVDPSIFRGRQVPMVDGPTGAVRYAWVAASAGRSWAAGDVMFVFCGRACASAMARGLFRKR